MADFDRVIAILIRKNRAKEHARALLDNFSGSLRSTYLSDQAVRDLERIANMDPDFD